MEGADGKYTLRLNSYLAMQGMEAEAVVQQAFLVAQAHAQGAQDLARIPVTMSSPGGHSGGPYAAYLLPGLLGLNLLMLGVFSTGMVDVTMRERGGYKRLATTPMPRGIYLAAQASFNKAEKEIQDIFKSYSDGVNAYLAMNPLPEDRNMRSGSDGNRMAARSSGSDGADQSGGGSPNGAKSCNIALASQA